MAGQGWPTALLAQFIAEGQLGVVESWTMGRTACAAPAVAAGILAVARAAVEAAA